MNKLAIKKGFWKKSTKFIQNVIVLMDLIKMDSDNQYFLVLI